MSCEPYSDLYELYSLGLLEGKERCELEEHLAGGCSVCEAAIRRALELNAIISSNVPLADPPPWLRRRILGSFHPEPDRAEPQLAPNLAPKGPAWRLSPAWLAFAASLLVIGGLIWRIEYQRNRNTAQYDQLSAAARILQAPETRTVLFGPQTGREPSGRLYVNRNLGVVIAVSSLPAAPAGWTYESWIVPKVGSPRPVSPIATQQSGQVFTLIPGPIDANTVMAVALSLEPPGARLEKPTRVLFAAPV